MADSLSILRVYPSVTTDDLLLSRNGSVLVGVVPRNHGLVAGEVVDVVGAGQQVAIRRHGDGATDVLLLQLSTPSDSLKYGYLIVSLENLDEVASVPLLPGCQVVSFTHYDLAAKFWRFYRLTETCSIAVVTASRLLELSTDKKNGVVIDFDVDTGHYVYIEADCMNREFMQAWGKQKAVTRGLAMQGEAS